MRSFYGDEPIEGVVCPLCLAGTGRVIYKVTAAESAQAIIRPAFDQGAYLELLAVIRDLWGGEECRQVRCDGCNSVFAWPHVAGNARFYNLAYNEHLRYPQKRWEFFAAARFVSRDAAGPILELGAGDGAFVRILLNLGVSARAISVIEYSDNARDQLAAIDSGLSVFSSLEQFVDRSEPHICSHVFAFQVMEHVQQPGEHLAGFRKVLKTGGLVCLAVPNPGHIEANERNGLLLDLPPSHITRFTVLGISAVAQREGFEVIHTEIEPLVYRSWLIEFLSYHFKRRMQDGASIQNWMERSLPWRLATIGGAVMALPSAISHSFEPKEGGSLFCVLRAI